MIVVNILFSLVLIIGLLLYRFIFPKKKINLFFLLILISILPIISIFRNGDYESGDFNIHIYREMAFYDSLREGNIMPSWAKDLNATYGYPLFIFNYPLPYYILSFFHFLGLSFIASMKLFLSLNLILSGVFMYLFSKSIFKNNLAAFAASIFYIFTPYHLIDVHFKATIGEILAFTILPLVFFFAQKYYAKNDFVFLLFAGFFLAFLIMSQPVIAILAAIILFLYLKNSFLERSCISIIALVVSFYVWAPPIIYNSYLFIQKVPLKTVYFPQIFELLYSPWKLGFLFQGPIGQTSFLIGYTQIFVLLITSILLILKIIPKKYINDLRFWTITSLLIIFLITPYSKFLWDHFSFAKAAGSHRLLLLLTFSISVLAGFFSLVFVKKRIFVIILIITTIGYTILNWGHRRVIPEINDNFLKQNLWKSTSEGEAHFYANTKWVNIKNPWFSKLPKNHLKIINGNGEIKDISKTSTLHKYIVNAKSSLEIQENTLYFPGWKGFLDGKEILISPSKEGIIQASVLQGKHKFEIIYQDIFIYKLLKIISVLSFVGIITFISLRFLRSYLR